ncbi:MAG: FAD-dependent oxidoreductase, partial [Cyanobacteria bacterium J06649_11]
MKGSIHKLEENGYQLCVEQGTDSFNISTTGNGICMQYHDCSRQFCKKDKPWNIPAYSVEALNVEDVQKSIAFANKHNLPVSVKTSGHNYAGSSTGKDSLLIWMYNFESYLKTVNDVKKNYMDTCGTKYPHVVKIGGGQSWGSVYKALGSDYHIVGAYCLTVSAAGGWLQGCGLSVLSRKNGLGIDNVLSFEIVLASGILVYADACTNPDLFWALRGGGGGTWGVVTSVHYKIYPVEPVLEFTMSITNPLSSPLILNSWIKKWIAISPYLDRRWAGYWTTTSFQLYFVGTEKDARTTFINDFEHWRGCLPKSQINKVVYGIKKGKSYYDIISKQVEIPTGQGNTNFASRLVPRDFLVNHPTKAAALLKHLMMDNL